jgi:UDP-2,4-diacetamido-2,4,6-trideoxy-beta-L-altropyranose hydrolase
MRQIAFRVDGGPGIGMGHVFRSLALASFLAKDDITCHFLMQDIPQGTGPIIKAGFPLTLLPDHNPNAFAADYLKRKDADALVVDLYDVPVRDRELLAAVSCPTLTISDLYHDDHPGSILVNGFICYGKSECHDTSYGGTAYLGSDYKIVRAAPPDSPSEIPARASNLLLTSGGSDESGLFPLALHALNKIAAPLEVTILEGPALDISDPQYIEAVDQCTHPLERVRSDWPFEIMSRAHLAVSAGGDTVYDLAVLGVPTIILSHVAHQLVTAQAFAERELALNLGLVHGCSVEDLHQCLQQTIDDAALRQQLSEKGRQALDGKGVERVADLLRGLLSK